MLINDFAVNGSAETERVSARIEWEEASRPPLTLYAELERQFASGWSADPNAFLVACFLPAWNAGERRIAVDGPVCPVLLDHLGIVAHLLKSWYPELDTAPTIEVRETRTRTPAANGACAFLSCGIDSLCTLRANQVWFPRSHPLSIRAALTAHFASSNATPSAEEIRSSALISAEVVEDLRIDAIPIVTNVKELEPNGNVFVFKWHGAALSFLAHLYSGRFSTAFLASSYDAGHLEPWGSHPLLDPGYEAAHLRIEHEGHGRSRFDKTAMVAAWPAGLNAVRVCQSLPASVGNCGTCEKCIRTQTALAALGRLEGTTAFANSDMTPELLRTVVDYDMIYNDSQAHYYAEMRGPLAGAGRTDLARVVDDIVAYYCNKRERISDRSRRIAAIIGQDPSFALAHNDLYGGTVVSGRGYVWGQPSEGEAAAREVVSLKEAGYECIVFPADTWWLEAYPELREQLEQLCTRKISNEEVIVYWV